MERRSLGRQKVKMEKMEKESNLQVTFSKRRSGLFKKASELCTLCGAEVALVVFSPGKKVFSFGHPSVEAIAQRCLGQNSTGPVPTSDTMQLVEGHRNAHIRALNMQLTQLMNELDEEKKRGEELNKIIKTNQANIWWQKPIEELNKEQLEQVKGCMERLQKDVTEQVERLMVESSSNSHQVQYLHGSSSNPAAGPAMILPSETTNVGLHGNMATTQGYGSNYGSYGRGFM